LPPQYTKYKKEITHELTEAAEKLDAIFRLGIRTLLSLPYGLSTEIDVLDKAFAEEIAFLYYLSLYDNKYFPGDLYYSAAISKYSNTYDLPPVSPIDLLSTILFTYLVYPAFVFVYSVWMSWYIFWSLIRPPPLIFFFTLELKFTNKFSCFLKRPFFFISMIFIISTKPISPIYVYVPCSHICEFISSENCP
jgi:hypothetical protein